MTVKSWSPSAPHWFEAVNHKLESQNAIGNIPNSTAMSPRGKKRTRLGGLTMSAVEPRADLTFQLGDFHL
jgi:hypothetical protein